MSRFSIDAVLLHHFPNNSKKAVNYVVNADPYRKKIGSHMQKECLVLVFATHKCHKMIHSLKFMLQMDHNPLVALIGAKKGKSVHTADSYRDGPQHHLSMLST